MTHSSLAGRPLVTSWSGGKDSCLALYRAIRQGGVPHALLTVLTETGERSRSHALPRLLLQKQADALEIPLVTCNASWDTYEAAFIGELGRLRADGIEVGVFGDIDLPEHRQWEEKVCSAAGLEPYLPLWDQPREQLVEEFISLGFQAYIVAVKDDLLDTSYLGRKFDLQLLADLRAKHIDPCGESGEFHTVVTGGPIFHHEIHLTQGPIVGHAGYSFISCA